MALLINGASEMLKNESKVQKVGFLVMLLGTSLGASLLGSMLSGKRVIQAGERTVKVGQDF